MSHTDNSGSEIMALLDENAALCMRLEELEELYRQAWAALADACKAIRALEGVRIPYPEAMALSRCLKLIEAYLKEHGQ